jgi:hypothetical protein
MQRMTEYMSHTGALFRVGGVFSLSALFAAGAGYARLPLAAESEG